MRSVLLAIPTYNGWNTSGTRVSVHNASDDLDVSSCDFGGSLLPVVFNRAWVAGVVGGFDLFAMLHADVQAESLWLSRLVRMLDEHDLDILSCLVPIKDETRTTSTAWDAGHVQHRITYDDVPKLPEVFTNEDVRKLYPESKGLLVNTGCWVARLRGESEYPWVRTWPGFTLQSTIDWTQDPPLVRSGSEDYLMSRWMNANGVRIGATSAIKVWHVGTKAWATPWGK